MTIWISTNGRPSDGAKALSSQAGFRRLRTGRGVRHRELVINWGSGKALEAPQLRAGRVPRIINLPELVGAAANKLTAFRKFAENEIKTVDWTTDREVARAWKTDRKTVVVRNKLTGHSGDGIVIIAKDSEDDVPQAPLYTKYLFKEKEFRIHVVDGRVIDTQRKIRDPEREPTDWKVRSHANGFIYVRENIEEDTARDRLAIAAVGALGLTFGAVDVIQSKDGECYVLEVNTGPGLEGQTLSNYAEAFRGYQG